MAQLGKFTKTSSNCILEMGEVCNMKFTPVIKFFTTSPMDAGRPGCESVDKTTNIPIFLFSSVRIR